MVYFGHTEARSGGWFLSHIAHGCIHTPVGVKNNLMLLLEGSSSFVKPLVVCPAPRDWRVQKTDGFGDMEGPTSPFPSGAWLRAEQGGGNHKIPMPGQEGRQREEEAVLG